MLPDIIAGEVRDFLKVYNEKKKAARPGRKFFPLASVVRKPTISASRNYIVDRVEH